MAHRSLRRAGRLVERLGGQLCCRTTSWPKRTGSTPHAWRYWRHILANTGVTLEFARESVPPPPFDTPGEAVDWSAERFGPLMMLRDLLEQQGRSYEVRAKMISIYDSGGPLKYLVVQGRKEG